MDSNLNLYDGSIDKKFSIEISKSSITSTNWRISNENQHTTEHLQSKDTSKGSIINEEQHEAFLQALVSYENPKFKDP